MLFNRYVFSNVVALRAMIFAAVIGVSGCNTDSNAEIDSSLGSATSTDSSDASSSTGTDSSSSSGLVTLSVDGALSVSEPYSGEKAYSVTVTLSQAYDSEITLDYVMNEISARAGQDYVSESGTLTIPRNTTSYSLPFTIHGDTVDENTESFVITISNPSYGQVGTDSESIISVYDFGKTPIFSLTSSTSVDEPDGVSADYTVSGSLSERSDRDITLDYEMTAVSAEAGTDFLLDSGTITVPSNSTSFTIPLTVYGDSVDESAETFLVSISNPSTGAVSGANSQSTVTIEDSSNAPVFSIENSSSVTEPSDGSSTFGVEVSLSAKSDREITVDYELISITAQGGSDFVLSSGTVIVPANSTQFTVPFTVNGDAIDEDNQTFMITISNASYGEISTTGDQCIVTIQDSSDDVSKVSFEKANYVVSEDSGTYTLNVLLSSQTERDVEIPFTISSTGLATKNADYTLVTSSPLSVASGSTEVSITLELIDDGLPEGGESIVLDLETPDNAALGDITETTIMIPGEVGLNDTGVVSWFDGSVFAATETNTAYPGQDADYGRDADASNVNYDGAAGFTFTKLDESGNALVSSESSFTCVKDNRTNLVWEIKQTSQGLPTTTDEATNIDYSSSSHNWRAVNYQYYWHNSDSTVNGGGSGTTGDIDLLNESLLISASCANPYYSFDLDTDDDGEQDVFYYCNTQDYLELMNSLSVCGYSDWRLPTTTEIASIENYRSTAAESDEEEYFDEQASGEYLTATTSADASGAIWCFDTDKKQTKFCRKNTPNYVRAVRGGAE